MLSNNVRQKIAGFFFVIFIGVNGTYANNENISMADISERYIKLVLGVGAHEPGYVDAYYGPSEFAETVEAHPQSIGVLKQQAATLLAAVRALNSKETAQGIKAQRIKFLEKQLIAIETRLRMLEGETFSFDEETSLLFDAVAPSVSVAELETTYQKLEHLIDGEGTLQDRIVRFKGGFMIPKDRLQAVFDAAIKECRTQTRKYLALPTGESFVKEFVTDKPWSGYNWFKGNAHSLIQVNTDLPSPIDAAVNLGCHEGYPGHHVFNARLEDKLVNENGWLEFSVYPLYSPQSFLAEGTASYARHMAFPDNSQTEFEENTLYPLAGLDTTQAKKYTTVLNALAGLRYARIEGSRRYLDGKMTREELANWFQRYSLVSKERAEQMISFAETYRGYVINYTLGSDLTKEYVDRHGGVDHKSRWTAYTRLLSEPFTASMMNN